MEAERVACAVTAQGVLDELPIALADAIRELVAVAYGAGSFGVRINSTYTPYVAALEEVVRAWRVAKNAPDEALP